MAHEHTGIRSPILGSIGGPPLALLPPIEGGGGGGVSISHPFTSVTSVTVVHNFGLKPIVSVLDTSNNVFGPFGVHHIDDNSFTVSFDAPTSGTIIATIGSGSGFSGGGGGESGFSGHSGKSGYSGFSGANGASGISGKSGYSGAGASGFSGFSGESGASGDSGLSGYSGRSGFSGVGVSGFSGASGASGASGFSGQGGGYRHQFTSYAGTITLDCNSFDNFTITMTGNPTINFSGGYERQKLLVDLVQGAGGSHVPVWGTMVSFGTDIASVTPSSAAGLTDHFGFIVRAAAGKYDMVAYARGYT